MRLVFFIAFGMLAIALLGQPTSLMKLRVAEDLAVFTTALEEAHPGMYLHQSKKGVDNLFGEPREHKVGASTDLRGS